MDIKDVVNKLMRYKDEYYSGKPSITDEEFDKLEDELRYRDPNNEYFNIVGYRLKHDSNTIEHLSPMLSISKVKDGKDVVKWCNNFHDKYTGSIDWGMYMSYKLDGLACSVMYDKEYNLQYIATRGDGKIGQIIGFEKEFIDFHLIPKNLYDNKRIKIPPHKDITNIEIRGELILPKNSSLNTGNVPLRNICVGIIKQKNDKYNHKIKNMYFIPYTLLIYTKDDKFTYIDEETLIGVMNNTMYTDQDYSIVQKIHTESILMEEDLYLEYKRDKFPFETDGLVFSSCDTRLYNLIDEQHKGISHHKYNLALKPPSKSAITTLIDIIWSVGRTGRLKPVGVIEPIFVGGVNINNVTLHSCKYIKDGNINIGCTLLVERSNDVIPKVVRVEVPFNGEYSMPTVCPDCGDELTYDGVDLICCNLNNNCKGVLIKRIMFFIENIKCKGIGESSVVKIVNSFDINDIVDFCRVVMESNIDSIFNGEKTSKNIKDSLEKAINNAKQSQIIISLSISGIGTSQTLGKLNIETFDKITETISSDEKLRAFLKLDDSAIRAKVFEQLSNPYMKNLIYKMVDYFCDCKEDDKVESGVGGVCVTGAHHLFSRNDIQNAIESKGYEFHKTIKGNTVILIDNEPDIQSIKTQSAIKRGIKIMSFDDFVS